MEGIIIFVVWGLCGWACYQIAKSKNRNKRLWVVLGVMFGIFAILAISLMPYLPG